MYIPLNPDHVDRCWEKFKRSLLTSHFVCSIHNGRNSLSMNWTNKLEKRIDDIADKMKQADYVRLGSNRMNLIPVHFAIKFSNQEKGTLVELIHSDGATNTLKNDLQLVIQFAFFDNKTLKKLIIPFIIYDIIDPEVKVDIDENNNQMIINRQT